jgi:hypothetical protein
VIGKGLYFLAFWGMRMLRNLFLFLFILATGLIGGGWSQEADAFSASGLTVKDSRAPQELIKQRDSIYSYVLYLDDNATKPSPLDQLKAAILRHAVSPETIRLDVDDLRVMDFFPNRLHAGLIVRGGIAQADAKAARNLSLPNDQDVAVCIFSGHINGVPIQEAAYSPYKLGFMAVMVHSNKHFRAAVSDSIDQVAIKILKAASIETN